MNTNYCIRNLLRLICLLQENSNNRNCLEDGCVKPYLGPAISECCYNTRIITLYNKDGSIFSTSYLDDNGNTQISSLFRVQEVFDNCVTLLILREENGTYFSTRQTITIRLNCICAVKCITDTNIDKCLGREGF